MKLLYALFGVSMGLSPLYLLAQTPNADPKLLRIETYQRYTSRGDSTPFQRTIFTNPSPTLRTETTSQFEAGVWLEQLRFNYTLDGLRRNTEIIFERFDPTTRLFAPQTRTKNFPRGNSLVLLDSIYTYTWSENQRRWELAIRIKNRYSAQNRLLETESLIDIAGQSFRNRDVNFYDAQGNLIRIENFSTVLGQSQRTGVTWQTFRGNLLLTSTLFTPLTPTDSLPVSRTVNTYNASNLVATSEGSSWDAVARNWKKNTSSTYTYYPTQLPQSVITTSFATTPEQRTRTDFFFTSNSRIIQDRNFNWNTETQAWDINTKRFYIYDQASSLRSIAQMAKDLNISPNPALNWIQVDLPANCKVQAFNALGQIQKIGPLNGQQQVDISTWPSGLYWIIAQKGTEIWMGKVLKQ